jgi:hypothetical protein
MDKLEYQRRVADVDLGLELSWSESFSYITAEQVARGTPMLVSPMVPALEDMPAAVRKRLVVSNPDDPELIRRQLVFLIDHPLARRRIGLAAARRLRENNAKNILGAKRTLRRLIHARV